MAQKYTLTVTWMKGGRREYPNLTEAQAKNKVASLHEEFGVAVAHIEPSEGGRSQVLWRNR